MSRFEVEFPDEAFAKDVVPHQPDDSTRGFYPTAPASDLVERRFQDEDEYTKDHRLIPDTPQIVDTSTKPDYSARYGVPATDSADGSKLRGGNGAGHSSKPDAGPYDFDERPASSRPSPTIHTPAPRKPRRADETGTNYGTYLSGSYFDDAEPKTDRHAGNSSDHGARTVAVRESTADSDRGQQDHQSDFYGWQTTYESTDQRPVDLENTREIHAIADTYRRVRSDLVRESHPGITLSQEEELGGKATMDAASLLVVSGFMEAKAEQLKTKEAEAPVHESDPSGTELAENIAQNPNIFRDMVRHAEANPTGIHAMSIAAEESKGYKDKKQAILDQTEYSSSDSWWTKRKQEKSRGKANEQLLVEAGEKREWNVHWLTDQFSEYVKEGRGGLWESMEIQPNEAGSLTRHRHNGKNDVGKVQSIPKLKPLYEMNIKPGPPAGTPAGAELRPENAGKLLWKYRVKPLDELYCESHPEAVLSPRTLERSLRLAADQFEGRIGRKATKSDKTEAEPLAVDIEKTAHGLILGALDEVIDLAKSNYQKHAFRTDGASYIRGEMPTQMHDDIEKLTALKLALSNRFGVGHKGEAGATMGNVVQTEMVADEQIAMREAGAYFGADGLADLQRGELRLPDNKQVEMKAQSIASMRRHLRQFGSPEEANIKTEEEIKRFTSGLRGREMTKAGQPNPDAKNRTIAGFHVSQLYDKTPDQLRELQQTISLQIQEEYGKYGTQPHESDPLSLDLEQLTQIIHTLENKDRSHTIKAIQARRESRAAQEHLNGRFPDEQNIHFAVGRGGSAVPYAGLVAAEGSGVIAQVSTEGVRLPSAVRIYSQDLSERQHTGGRPTEFSEQQDPSPRNVQYGLLVADGPDKPVGFTAEHFLNLLSPEGIGVIPIRRDSAWVKVASRVIELANKDPRYAGRYSVETVPSADISISPTVTYEAGPDKAALVVTPLTENSGEAVPNETHERIRRRLASTLEPISQPTN